MVGSLLKMVPEDRDPSFRKGAPDTLQLRCRGSVTGIFSPALPERFALIVQE